ncbi:MAG: VOC family protein [Paracoccaceae bacterium]|mgnify:FL=1
MRFVNPLPFVKDIEASKRFYCSTLSLSILEDRGNFVKFANGFAMHDGGALFRTVFGVENTSALPYGRGNLVLYFEETNLDETFARISQDVVLIHAIREEPWGQRVFRFFDPDRHVIELGEPQ